MTHTKADIVDTLYRQLDLPKHRCVELLETLIGLIKDQLEKGDDVLVSGFGKFYVRAKDERMGRNFQTGENMMMSSRRVVRFKCSGKLRDKINIG